MASWTTETDRLPSPPPQAQSMQLPLTSPGQAVTTAAPGL